MQTAQITRLVPTVRRHTTHTFTGVDSAPFDVAAYSRMKFGSGADARKIGYEMAEAFAAEFWATLSLGGCLLIPAPSTTVPVAATLMGWHMHNRLNGLLDNCGHPPVEWDLVHRAITYNDDYATRSLEERRKLLVDDARYMNTAFAQGKTLIFVDDVRITGTHEEKLAAMLADYGLNNPVVYATYAGYAGDRPAIEHELNHHTVKDGLCVARLSCHPEWSVTTRALRLLLEPDADTFERILRIMPPGRREQTYYASIVKGYSQHEAYGVNFHRLRGAVEGSHYVRP